MRGVARLDARDRLWILLLALSFAAGLAVSWQRWGNPLIDTGREMNQPLRLADGERLYDDVRHIYGPLSPWLHAELYRLFGPSLTVLYADGIISALLVLALTYWLARQIMSPAASGAAILSIMWLCVLRPAGNYILPYSYDALHATVLALLSMAILVDTARRTLDDPVDSPSGVRSASASAGFARPGPASPRLAFLLAGLITGLALLAKAEIGLATILAGLTAAALIARLQPRGAITLAAIFLAAAGTLAIAIYGAIALRVGWSTLIADSWLLLYNIPPELRFYNRRIAGLDHPLRSLERMGIAAVKLGAIAAVVGAISILLARRRPDATSTSAPAHSPASASAWRVLALAGVVLIATAATTGLDWDKGPFLAMPFLLVGLLAMEGRRLRADLPDRLTSRTAILIICTIDALASLSRMVLHVRSGGAYASFLLPVSVILLTYLLVEAFPRAFRDPRAGRIARAIMLTLILSDAVVMAVLLGYRYQTRNTAAITTARGSMIVEPDVGQAWNEALAYIARHTRPGDAVAVLPEGTSLDFLSGRRNPLREEIATPGFITASAEPRAIQQLEASRTDLILVTNRLTAEFGPAVFGRDYSQRLMQWIDTHYTPCAMFGPVKDQRLEIGARPFFIRAYCVSDAVARARGHAIDPATRSPGNSPP